MANRTVMKQILDTAEELLMKGWTQHAFARDKYMQQRDFTDDDAVCWCLDGALERSLMLNERDGYLGRAAYRTICNHIATRTGYNDITNWNDEEERTQDEVLELIRNTRKELCS